MTEHIDSTYPDVPLFKKVLEESSATSELPSGLVERVSSSIDVNLDRWSTKYIAPQFNDFGPEDGTDDADIYLPPPKPFFDRCKSTSYISNAVQLIRARSSSELSPPKPHLSQKISEMRGMTQSMPSMCSSRAAHNRVLGCAVLQSEIDSDSRRRSELKAKQRAVEFDTFLENL